MKRLFLLSLFVGIQASAGPTIVEAGGYLLLPKLQITETTSGLTVMSVNVNTRFGFDGLTGAKYLSSNGTNLVLTGLTGQMTGLGIGTAPSYLLHLSGAVTGGVMLGLTGSSMISSDLGIYIGGPTLTGAIQLTYMSATTTSYTEMFLVNSNSTSGTADARIQVSSTGASGGDPYFAMTISGVDNWAMGIDNSDSDKWKVSRSSRLGTNDLVSVTTAGAMDTASTISSNLLKVPVVHGSGTAAQAIESGSGAATAATLAVTFGTAFATAPNCVCADTNAVPVPCGISVAADTTSVSFKAVGTDTIQWICIGAR